MRQIGVIFSHQEAERFAAYLVTQGVAAHAEPDGAGSAIWVRDENHLPQAREELDRFRANPTDSRYQGVEREAASLAKEREREREKARRNVVEMRGRWGRPSARNQPITMVIIGLCVVVAILTQLGEARTGVAMRTLLFADTMQPPGWDIRSLQDRLVNIKQGEVWRLVTPIFVHYGVAHLVFNMIMLYQLGGYLEHRVGSWRFAILLLLTGAISMAAQSLVPVAWQGTPFAAGMSGALYGILGFMWMKTAFDPASGIFVPMSTVVILGVWLFLGIFGVLESMFGMNVANWAHGVGLAAGVVLGLAPISWTQSPKRRSK